MGYRKIPTIYTLSFADPDYEGLEVRLKSVRLGRLRKMLKLSDEGNAEGFDEIVDLLVENLVSWNLENEDGVPVPATREGLDAQEIRFVMDIFSTWVNGMTGTDEELGKGFGSGEISPVALPTMEAL